MGSFDKSYYDILKRYQGIIKEGMAVKPIVYKKQGDNYVPANDLDLKIIPPELLFTKSEDPAAPFVPYNQQTTNSATQQQATNTGTQPAQPNVQQRQQPSISVTGDSTPQTSTNIPAIGQRIQYPSSVSTNTPTQGVGSTPASKATTSPVKSVPPTRPNTSQSTNSLPTNSGKKPSQQSYMRRA